MIADQQAKKPGGPRSRPPRQCGSSLFAIGWNLAMQENVEERMHSRAYSYEALGSYVAVPVGQLVHGPLGETFGTSAVLLWSGVAYVLISLLVLASRSVRTLDRHFLEGIARAGDMLSDVGVQLTGRG
jgi:hypothetical protein